MSAEIQELEAKLRAAQTLEEFQSILAGVEHLKHVGKSVQKRFYKEELRRARAAIDDLAARYNKEVADVLKDLEAAKARRNRVSATAGRKVAPKYRHPETGETWTGRGMQPRWVREYLEQGGDLESLRIDEAA